MTLCPGCRSFPRTSLTFLCMWSKISKSELGSSEVHILGAFRNRKVFSSGLCRTHIPDAVISFQMKPWNCASTNEPTSPGATETHLLYLSGIALSKDPFAEKTLWRPYLSLCVKLEVNAVTRHILSFTERGNTNFQAVGQKK